MRPIPPKVEARKHSKGFFHHRAPLTQAEVEVIPLLSLPLTQQVLLQVWGSLWLPPCSPYTISSRFQFPHTQSRVPFLAAALWCYGVGHIWPAWSSSQAEREVHSQLLSITKVPQTRQAHSNMCGFSITSFQMLFTLIHHRCWMEDREKSVLHFLGWKPCPFS